MVAWIRPCGHTEKVRTPHVGSGSHRTDLRSAEHDSRAETASKVGVGGSEGSAVVERLKWYTLEVRASRKEVLGM